MNEFETNRASRITFVVFFALVLILSFKIAASFIIAILVIVSIELMSAEREVALLVIFL